MIPLTESGLVFDRPRMMTFRFSELPSYAKVSSHGIKECDLSVLEEDSNMLWHIELKSGDGLAHEKPISYSRRLANESVIKINSTVALCASALLKKGIGQELFDGFPPAFQHRLKLARMRFLVLVDLSKLGKEQRVSSQILRSGLQSQTRAARMLFGLRDEDVLFLTYDEFLEKFSKRFHCHRANKPADGRKGS